MKLALAFALSLLALSAMAAPAQSPASPPVDPNKPAVVTLSLADWNAVISSIGDSARVSAHDANRIGQSIVSQVQPQVVPAQTPARK